MVEQLMELQPKYLLMLPSNIDNFRVANVINRGTLEIPGFKVGIPHVPF